MQGDIHFTADPKVLTTVLGSCVAVCLWDKQRSFWWDEPFRTLPSDRSGEKNTRYGDVAIDKLSLVWCALAADPGPAGEDVWRCRGVAVWRRPDRRTEQRAIGVGAIAPRSRIRITAQRTGGTLGMQIRFHTRTGEAFVAPYYRLAAAIKSPLDPPPGDEWVT